MVSSLTRHGPAMLDKMREKHLAWPHFSAEEMSSLIAYLNSGGARLANNPEARPPLFSAERLRPLVSLSNDWISMVGVAIVTTTGVFWLFLLPFPCTAKQRTLTSASSFFWPCRRFSCSVCF